MSAPAQTPVTEYVLGFAFDPTGTRLALIQKRRGPLAVSGTYNGVGGKLGAEEAADAGMRREFREETGVDLDRWLYFAADFQDTYALHLFAVADERVLQVKTVEDEAVFLFDLRNGLPRPLAPNVAAYVAEARALLGLPEIVLAPVLPPPGRRKFDGAGLFESGPLFPEG